MDPITLFIIIMIVLFVTDTTRKPPRRPW